MITRIFLENAKRSLTESILYIDSLCDNLLEGECERCPLNRRKKNACISFELEKMILLIQKEIEERYKIKKDGE